MPFSFPAFAWQLSLALSDYSQHSPPRDIPWRFGRLGAFPRLNLGFSCYRILGASLLFFLDMARVRAVIFRLSRFLKDPLERRGAARRGCSRSLAGHSCFEKRTAVVPTPPPLSNSAQRLHHFTVLL
jgi:hypothetical protein